MYVIRTRTRTKKDYIYIFLLSMLTYVFTGTLLKKTSWLPVRFQPVYCTQIAANSSKTKQQKHLFVIPGAVPFTTSNSSTRELHNHLFRPHCTSDFPCTKRGDSTSFSPTFLDCNFRLLLESTDSPGNKKKRRKRALETKSGNSDSRRIGNQPNGCVRELAAKTFFKF